MNYNVQECQPLKMDKKGLFGKMLNSTATEKNIVPEKAITNMTEAKEVLECVKTSKNQLDIATMNFEYADSDELVDYYTYVIKACQVRYGYYLKQAKDKGLKVETLDVPTYC
jgi:hypothetical protein